MPLAGSVARVLHGQPTQLDSFFSLITPQFLSYHDFSNTIVHRDPLFSARKDSFQQYDDIYFRIVHPYITDAFHHFISKHCFIHFYSLLVTNLGNGFPLGEMPLITDTVIFKNHPSAIFHSDAIDKYLTDELSAGRMSGPFSRRHVEIILRGPFFCSPLLVSVQTQQPGMPDKLRVCRHLSKGDKNTPSMNSHIHKEDFPTRFDTASKVADIVRSFPVSGHLLFLFMSFTSGGLLSSWVSLLVTPSSRASLLVTCHFTGSLLVTCHFMGSLLVTQLDRLLGSTSGNPALCEFASATCYFISLTG
jgi:hypothetical protein